MVNGMPKPTLLLLRPDKAPPERLVRFLRRIAQYQQLMAEAVRALLR